VTTTDAGDLLWINVTADVAPPTAQVVDLATSTHGADADEWEAFTSSATG
jgi:hypothetical protein